MLKHLSTPGTAPNDALALLMYHLFRGLLMPVRPACNIQAVPARYCEIRDQKCQVVK